MSQEIEEPLDARELPEAPHPPLDVREISVEDISENDNIRIAYHGIDELADTIHVQGLLHPVVVRPTPEADEPFELVFGHRRLQAVKQLGWETIRAEVRDIPDDRRLGQMIVENYQREELSPVAEARAILALKNSSTPPLSNAEVGRRLGIHPSQVTKRLNLLDLAKDAPEPAEEKEGDSEEKAPEKKENKRDIDILQAIDDGKISASAAEVVVSMDDHDDRQKLAKLIVRNDWTVSKAQNWANKVKAEEGAIAEQLEEIPPAEVLRPSDITKLKRISLREDLTESEIGRVNCWALLRNGMDAEMLEYLDEEMGFPYHALWDYVASLDDEQVKELTRRLVIRYVSAAHRFHDLEPTLIEQLGMFEGEEEQDISSLDLPDAGSWTAIVDLEEDEL